MRTDIGLSPQRMIAHALFALLLLGSAWLLQQPAQAATSDTVHHVLISGQSLSLGYGSAGPLTTTPSSNHLMFAGGLAERRFNGLEPLYELGFETIASGFAETLTNLQDDANAAPHDMLISLSGYAGSRIDSLDSAGGDPYKTYYRNVFAAWAGKYLTGQAGRGYEQSAVLWLQGESDVFDDTAGEEYRTRLQQLQADYQSDVATATGVSKRLPLLTYQTNAVRLEQNDPGAIALAQRQAGDQHPDIYTVTPIYSFDYADALHLTAHGYRHLGAYFAKVYKKVVVDGEEWRPLLPIAAERSGVTVTVEFHVPEPPLVLDTAGVANPGNFGFSLYDENGSVPIQVVRLAGADRVEILAARSMTGAVEVRYAHDGAALADYWGQQGQFQGARGNLRDSDPAIGYGLDASGQPYRLYNWALVFRMPVDDAGQCSP